MMQGADASMTLPIPPTPWVVTGQALLVIGHLSRRRARTLAGAPRGFAAPPLLGSVAALGLIAYADTPVGAYHELAVFPGVLWRDIPGAFVSHMLVDSLRSQLAGRALWGLPKEQAQFAWGSDQVTVADPAGQEILTASWQVRGDWPPLAWPPLPVMTLRGPRRQLFTAGGHAAGVQRARVRLHIPSTSPLAPLAALTHGPHVALLCQRFRLRLSGAFDLL